MASVGQALGSVEGTLHRVSQCFGHPEHDAHWAIQPKNGPVLWVEPSAFGRVGPRLGSLEGWTVRLTGKLSGPRHFEADAVAAAVPPPAPKPVRLDGTTEVRPYLFIKADYADSPDTHPHEDGHYAQLVGNAYPGLNHMYTGLSYGKVSLDDSVMRGWVKLPKTYGEYNASGYDMWAVISDAVGLVKDSVDLTKIWGIAVMVDGGIGGAWGLASGFSYEIAPGVWKPFPINVNAPGHEHFVLAHEIGHNMGFSHCANWYGAEYGSNYSCMGYGNFATPQFAFTGIGFNAYHRWLVGWMDKGRVDHVYRGQKKTVTLTQLTGSDPASTEPLLVFGHTRSQIGSKYSHHDPMLSVELRKTADYDNVPGMAGEGIAVQAVSTSAFWGFGWVETQQFDDNGDGNSDGNDASGVLTEGESFTDAKSGFRVRALAADGQKQTVEVSLDGANDIGVVNGRDLKHGFFRVQDGAVNGWKSWGSFAIGWQPWGSADVNRDGEDDLVMWHLSRRQLGAFLLENGAVTGWKSLARLNPMWFPLGFLDIDGAGGQEVLMRRETDGLTVVHKLDEGNFSGYEEVGRTNLAFQPLAVEDMNRDGMDDLFMLRADGIFGFYALDGAKIKSWTQGGRVPRGWKAVAAGHYNEDGYTDLLMVRESDGRLDAWLLTNGKPSGWKTIGRLPQGWQVFGVGRWL